MSNEEPIPHATLPIIPSVEEEAAAYLANQKSTKGRWQRFVSFVWDPDYYEKSDAERHLVHKLDCGILIAIVFSYIMKAIDQSNIGNAYVTGMREDLKMFGNQYTYCLVIYNAVYCFMQVPANFLCLKFRPSIVLASCEIGWGIATFAQAGAQNYQQVYVFRFFVGLFEAPFQPATALLLGSWYSPPELAKRVAVWFLAARSGSAFSGFLTAAINSGMDGYAGLAGWRWLYIICGIMTLPAGISLYFLLPDYPSTTKVWYLTDEEKKMAQARCARQGTKPHTGIVNFQTFKRIVKRWPFWVMTPTYLFYAWCVQAYTVFTPYLLQTGYPRSLRTIYPAVSDIIGLPFVFLWGFLSDRTGSRYLWTLIPSLWALVPNGILAVYAPSKSLRLFAYLACHTYFVTHIFFTWVNEICKNDAEERAFVIGASNCFFYAFNSWLPTLLTLQTDGPKWTMGFWSFFGSNVISCGTLTLAWVLHRRQLREEARERHLAGTEGANVETILVDDEKDPKALEK